MDCYVTLILLFSGFSISSCSHFSLRQYHYIDLTMTWNNAQHYCRMKYTDLATFEKINKHKKTYTFVSIGKSWADARNYCREYHTDLAMIENSEENHEVRSAAPLDYNIWTGLYQVAWTWSDKSQSSFRSWQSGSPNNIRQDYSDGDEFCAVENPSHEWDDHSCWKKYPFICQQVLKRKTTVRMTFKTDADITDPAANAQILQQLSAVLTGQGWTDFKLQWKLEPRKQEKPHCIFHF
ncbi:uncharacterized protein LOC144464407 [Epinephelus lanceolatus]